MTTLSDPTSGAGYAFGAILPSSHMTTIATQQPRAVDGGTPVGGIYPGDIAFSGDHNHKGTVEIDAAGGNLLINGTLNGAPTGGTIDLTAVDLGLDGISVDDIDFHVTETTPTISQPQLAGVGNTAGYPLTVRAQQGQGNGAGVGGIGGNLVLGIGRPGAGTNKQSGRLVKQWGDSAGYKWISYEWCSGELAYTDVPLDFGAIPIAPGEIHAIEGYMISRRSTGTNRSVKNAVVIKNVGGTVSADGTATIWGIGSSSVTLEYSTNGTTNWSARVYAGVPGQTGDFVVFLQWQVVSLNGI